MRGRVRDPGRRFSDRIPSGESLRRWLCRRLCAAAPRGKMATGGEARSGPASDWLMASESLKCSLPVRTKRLSPSLFVGEDLKVGEEILDSRWISSRMAPSPTWARNPRGSVRAKSRWSGASRLTVLQLREGRAAERRLSRLPRPGHRDERVLAEEPGQTGSDVAFDHAGSGSVRAQNESVEIHFVHERIRRQRADGRSGFEDRGRSRRIAIGPPRTGPRGNRRYSTLAWQAQMLEDAVQVAATRLHGLSGERPVPPGRGRRRASGPARIRRWWPSRRGHPGPDTLPEPIRQGPRSAASRGSPAHPISVE